MKSPHYGKRNYNFDFEDDDEDESSYNANHSRGGSSNETRGSDESLGEEREDLADHLLLRLAVWKMSDRQGDELEQLFAIDEVLDDGNRVGVSP